ncbi:acetylornithine deacetylase [Terrihabitans sp. B22-R8]|uniref:acetylornithine deacetylase n=1 Tax=Terrihabitans sp. B22-R8 TaxID=3425128 RepID=UPI00403C2148
MITQPSPSIIAILEKLVSFDTTSDRSNLELIGWVQNYLADAGVAATVVPNASGTKALLFARIGPEDVPALALSAHTDVVPVSGQEWSSDPFVLTLRDDRLYGRGACDMKGFIAVVLAAVPALRAASLKRPVQIVLTYDEETTMDGVADALRALGMAWQPPHAVIVGEPTSMRVVDAHLSIAGVRMDITGRAAHSSLPHLGASAVLAAHEIIGELQAIAAEFRDAGDPTGRFTPPHSTLNIGRIEGGSAHNIVPVNCSLEFSMRGVPGCDIDAAVDRIISFALGPVLQRLQETAPEARIAIDRWLVAAALAPDPGSPAERIALRLAEANDTTTVAYATEAGAFQRAGLPVVVCGPGSIDQAHTPDEYIELSQLAAGEAFMARLIRECSAAPL